MIRSRVDLPHPEGPISETNSPGAMSRSMPWSATVRAPSRAWGRAWHVPSDEPRSQRQALTDLAAAMDAPPARVGSIPWPVLSVLDFESEDEALRIANESRFGLAASVWTSSLDRAHRLARRLRVGTVSVNTVDALSPQTPFGGFKGSGFGRDLSLHALDKYTGLKTTWIKHRP